MGHHCVSLWIPHRRKVLNSISTLRWTTLQSIPGSQHKGVLIKSAISILCPNQNSVLPSSSQFLLEIFCDLEAKHKEKGEYGLRRNIGFCSKPPLELSSFKMLGNLPSLSLPFLIHKMEIKNSYFMGFFKVGILWNKTKHLLQCLRHSRYSINVSSCSLFRQFINLSLH